MKPIEECPVCHVPVRWILHDGANSYDYDCSNKECPIQFNELVRYPNVPGPFDLKKDGSLLVYSFNLNEIHIKVIKKRLAIYPKGTGKFFIVMNQSESPWQDLLPWHDLKLLKNKIKIWITFS